MKKFFHAVALLALSALVGIGADYIWQIPHNSDIAIFYMLKIGFIPIPVPVGLFTSPHFWGGLLYVLAGIIALLAVGRLRIK
jgi:hypothetical protein